MKKLLCFTTLIIFLWSVHLHAQCDPAQDYIALRALYLSTDGDNWTNNTGWLTAAEFDANPTIPAGTDVGTWYGVTTNADGCVTCIDMDGVDNCSQSLANGNNLIGNIPSELGWLTNLTHLYLRADQLSGNIPTTLGDLVNLVELHLISNTLSGSIPLSLGNLVNLESLILQTNSLSGSIPDTLGNLMNLRTLDLRFNNLNGNIPISLGNLHNLTYLNLGGN